MIFDLEKSLGLARIKLFVDRVSGPTSYNPAARPTVDTGLRTLYFAHIEEEGGGEYLTKVVSIAGGVITYMVRDNIEQAVDEGGTSVYTIGGEVAAGTNLSGVTFDVIAIGEG